MKYFSSPIGTDYGSYTFGYANYCLREPGDSLDLIYQGGYLPYTGAPGVKDTFYMARSARVALKGFTLSSENRRIAKKFDGTFTKERVPLRDFRVTDDFVTFCLTYFAQKHGDRAMPRERLEHILTYGLVSHIIRYQSGGSTPAYALEVEGVHVSHFWFSFYDLALARQSLGLWIMLDGMREAKARDLAYYYLGTVYGDKALYKTNFGPLEWWDGKKWNNDVKTLKEHGRSDTERTLPLVDEWKQRHPLF